MVLSLVSVDRLTELAEVVTVREPTVDSSGGSKSNDIKVQAKFNPCSINVSPTVSFRASGSRNLV